MKRILSFFMVFVLLFNFVLPRRSEAVAPVVGALLSNPKTYVAVGSLLASAGIVYENRESLMAGVNDFLNKSAEIREDVHNAMLISGIYIVNGIQKNVFPVSQELYDSAVDYASGYTGDTSSVPITVEYTENDVIVSSTDYIIPYDKTLGVKNTNNAVNSSYIYFPSTDMKSSEFLNYLSEIDKGNEFKKVTSNIGISPFVCITPTENDWYTYHNNISTNAIPFKLLGKNFKVSVCNKHSNINEYRNFMIQSDTNSSFFTDNQSVARFTPLYLSVQPEYTSDENGVWYKGLRLYCTYLYLYNSATFQVRWQTRPTNNLLLQCNTPSGVSDNALYNNPDISAIFTTYDEASGLYMPSGAVYSATVDYSVSTPVTTEWDYSADEQVGIVLPSGSIDNYVGTPESVTAGELTTYTGEKTGELDWTSAPSEGEGEEGGGSISGEFDIGKWLTGTGEGTLSGTLDNAFSNVNAKIDSLTNSISNVFNPELSWENSNFRWFDFIILFLDVILACIRLTIRFLIFVVTLTQIVATPLISNSHMLQGIDFLKNITIPETNFTIWGLLTSFATAMIGVSAFKFIKRKFRF